MPEREPRFPESSSLNFDKLTDRSGVNVLPADIFDANTGRHLGLVFMSREAYEKTLELQELVAWSRERAEIWHKGETSGNRQIVKKIIPDCDNDTIEVYVESLGPFCHRETVSCFDQL